MRVRAAEGKGSWAARYHRSWCACACVCGAIVGQGLMRGTRDRHASGGRAQDLGTSMIDPQARRPSPLPSPSPSPTRALRFADCYACYPIVLRHEESKPLKD